MKPDRLPTVILDRVAIVVRVPALGPCWEWLGARTKNGYGSLRWKGRVVYVHRLVLAFKRRRQRKGIAGVYALHACDNKPCCNPDHLGPGTQSKNMTEWAKRRKSPKDIILLSETDQ